MHPNSLRDIPPEYRDLVQRLTIALLRAYNDNDALTRADDYLREINKMQMENRP